MSKHIVDEEKWSNMTIYEQMGNISSEVSRAFSALRRDDAVSARGAFYRGLDLFDATALVWAAKKSPRTKEILRARERFAELVNAKKTDTAFESYCFQYALAARRDK